MRLRQRHAGQYRSMRGKPKAFFRYVNGKLKSQSDFHNLKDVWQDMAFRVNFLIGCGSFSLVESSVFVSLDLFQNGLWY